MQIKRRIVGLVLVIVIVFLLMFMYIFRDKIFQQTMVIKYGDGCIEKYVNNELISPICVQGRILMEKEIADNIERQKNIDKGIVPLFVPNITNVVTSNQTEVVSNNTLIITSNVTFIETTIFNVSYVYGNKSFNFTPRSNYSLCPLNTTYTSIPCDCHKWGCALECFMCLDNNDTLTLDEWINLTKW
jgi:hypothetical protein